MRDYVKARLGKSYDTVFDLNNDQYYCSELLYFAFKASNKGTPIFQLRPMTFKDPDTGETFPIWQKYFEDLAEPIPEEAPATKTTGFSIIGSISSLVNLLTILPEGKI